MVPTRVAAAILSIGVAVSNAADEAPPPAPGAEAATRLTSQLRDRTAPLERQMDAVRGLTRLGPQGVDAWRDHLEREFARLDAMAASRPPETKLDRSIESLRSTLADLRADPDLTHEQLEQQGLPALDQLRTACAKRDAALKPWRTRQAAAHAQARRLAALVEACRVAGRDDATLAAAGPFDPTPLRDLEARLAPEDGGARAVLAENERIAKTLPPEVAAGTKAVDSVRMLCGLGPLLIDSRLCTAATGHSADMEAHDFFAHESPLPGKKEPWDRARLAGTTASAENIYMGGTSGTEAVKAWFLSPGHHKNLLADGHARQGLGRSGEHWTQLFGD